MYRKIFVPPAIVRAPKCEMSWVACAHIYCATVQSSLQWQTLLPGEIVFEYLSLVLLCLKIVLSPPETCSPNSLDACLICSQSAARSECIFSRERESQLGTKRSGGSSIRVREEPVNFILRQKEIVNLLLEPTLDFKLKFGCLEYS